MGEHYTRNTENVTAWCNKCGRQTQHRVDAGRKGPCLDCIEQAEKKRHETPVREKKSKPPAPQSGDLFGREK